MKKFINSIYSTRIVQLFFILLPFVEIVTSYMVINIDFPITIGVVYKTLFLIYGFIYLIFVDKVNKKWNYILLGIFAITIISNILFTITNLTMSNLIAKAVSMTKYVCFPMTLFFLYKYLKNGNQFSIKTLVISATIYATTMILSVLTGTSLPTYDTNPERGISGWIYSGNELSSLLALFYPIVIYYATKYKSLSFLYALGIITYGLLAIGTKTSLIALIFSLFSILIFSIILCIWKRNKIAKHTLILTILLMIGVTIVMPLSPSFKYLEDKIGKIFSNTTAGQENTDNKIQNFIFNGRDEYVYKQKELAKDASLLENIIGLKDTRRIIDESTGNYTIVERDFHDIKFGYGYLGLFVYFLPVILIAIDFLKRLKKNFKYECNLYNFCIGLSILLGFGISYIVGHVLLAPTVALFLATILVKFTDVRNQEHKIEEDSNKKNMIIYMPKLAPGGMELALINFLNLSYLKEKYAITINLGYCTDKELLERLPENVEVKLLCKGKWNTFNKLISVIKYAIECFNSLWNKYDIAVCYSYHHKILSMLTRNSSRNTIVFIHQDLINSRTPEEINILMKNLKFEKFKAIICVSDAAKKSMEQLMPKYKGKMFVVYNYIDGERIKKGGKEEIEDKIEKDKIIFINISRHLEKHKKITRIINAATKLREEGYSNFNIWLIGDGEDHQLYKKEIEEKKMQNIIILKGKQLNPYKYLAKSNCLIMSSAHEGYGIVIDESRVLHKPVISTNVADSERIMKEGYGILCENSEDGIYEAMKEFIKNGYILAKEFQYQGFNQDLDKRLKEVINYCQEKRKSNDEK